MPSRPHAVAGIQDRSPDPEPVMVECPGIADAGLDGTRRLGPGAA